MKKKVHAIHAAVLPGLTIIWAAVFIACSSPSPADQVLTQNNQEIPDSEKELAQLEMLMNRLEVIKEKAKPVTLKPEPLSADLKKKLVAQERSVYEMEDKLRTAEQRNISLLQELRSLRFELRRAEQNASV